MEKLLFLVVSFSFLMLVSAAILLSVYKGEVQVERRIALLLTKSGSNRLLSETASEETAFDRVKANFEQVFKPLWKTLRKQMVGKIPMHTQKGLEQKLRDAGYPFDLKPVDFRLLQIILGSTLFLITLLLFLPVSDNSGKAIVFALIAGGYGAFSLNLYLNIKKKKRILQLQKAMPDFFDMLSVSIEAGMGLDQALVKVCRRLEGPLSDEFLRALEDMRLGKSRREAFSEMRDRVPSESFQSIMRALIQADHLGIGMAKVLRTLTVRIREQRRQAAREQAMKAPVKMLFPMVFFIFPTLFIVLLGPLGVRFLTDGLF